MNSRSIVPPGAGSLPGAVAIANSVYTIASGRSIREGLKGEISHDVAVLDNARQIEVGLANMRSAVRGITLFTIRQHPEQVAKARSKFESNAAEMRAAIGRIDPNQLEPADREALRGIGSALDEWINQFKSFSSLCQAGRFDEADQNVLKYMTPLMDSVQKNASELASRSESLDLKAIQRIAEVATRSEYWR